jgi:hypothetical protein
MNGKSRNLRAAVVAATALCFVSSIVVAACGFRVTAHDFPVLKLTSSTEPATAAVK